MFFLLNKNKTLYLLFLWYILNLVMKMYGVALQGGGAKGAYQIGVLKAIREEKIKISAVVGTSIGAFNGAVFAQGDLDKLYDLWYNGSSKMIMDIDEKEMKKVINKKIDLDTIKYWYQFVKINVKNKGIEPKKIRALYNEYIDEKKLRSSKIEFGITTYNLTDRKPVQIYKENMEQGKMSEYIFASSYLPVFKQENIINEKKYIDGGVYDNCPLSLLTKKGYKDIIEIKTGSFFKPRRINRSKLNIITVEPSKDTGSILFADNKSMRKNIEMGYLDAVRIFKGYIGKKYYVIPIEDKKIFDILSNLTDKKIRKIIGGVNIDKEGNIPEAKKILFEKVIPLISNSLKSDDTTTYQKTIVSMIEKILEEKDANIYKIYKFDQILKIAKTKVPDLIRTQEKAIIKNGAKEMMLRLIREL